MKSLKCSSCGKKKLETEFYCLSNRKRKRGYWCKQCRSEWAKEHNQKPEVQERARVNARKPENRKRKALYNKKKQEDPNYREYRRMLHLRSTFNITLEDYAIMLKKQNNCCAICNISIDQIKQDVFDVDHDHKINVVRGLLCRKCNTYLKVVEDHEDWVEKAKKYLGQQSLYRNPGE